jgi:hypothetical protein
VGLDAAVVADMADGKAVPDDGARHQQAAVAVERLALCAHHADPAMRRFGDNAPHGGLEFRPPRHRLVIGDAVAIKALIARLAAKRIAE